MHALANMIGPEFSIVVQPRLAKLLDVVSHVGQYSEVLMEFSIARGGGSKRANLEQPRLRHAIHRLVYRLDFHVGTCHGGHERDIELDC